jgi:tripartite-type tricarboxylate transporter receptor subunit TctC
MKTAVPYDGVDSFTFINSYTDPVLGVVVRADAPWKTFQELVDEGKKNPGKLTFGSVGVNSSQHIVMEIVMKQTGARFVHVPQSGTAANIANVLGGHLDFLSDASSWAPNVRQGQMRVLAVSGDKRSRFFPDAPTFKEMGFEVISGRGAVVGPARLPEPIRARLEKAATKALGDERVKDTFATIATEISPLSGAEMRKLAVEDREVWRKMIANN